MQIVTTAELARLLQTGSAMCGVKLERLGLKCMLLRDLSSRDVSAGLALIYFDFECVTPSLN